MFSANTSQVSNDVKYIEDFFSAWLRTGTGSSQTVTTGIKENTGALVISKSRSAATDWAWYDTFRGATKDLVSNSTAAETTQSQGLTTFNTDGHTWGTLAKVNTSGATYVDFVLKPTPKFFDVVTYTGTGSVQAIPHNLGSVPGFYVVKRTDSTSGWSCYHRSLNGGVNPEDYVIALNSAAAAASAPNEFDTAPTSTHFYVGSSVYTNTSGATYVAYLFAHNAGGFGLSGTDNVISCGSYTGNGSATGPTVTLGYEPQWVLIKRASGGTQNWIITDNMRDFSLNGNARLFPNLADAESAVAGIVQPNATGFSINGTTGSEYNASGNTYIYIAIRRGPMKTPTDATKVYNAVTVTGNSTANRSITGFGFPLDLLLSAGRTGTFLDKSWNERLIGAYYVRSTTTAAEDIQYGGLADPPFAYMDGYQTGTNGGVQYYWNNSGDTYVQYGLKRAPGFFDEVCYTGTGTYTNVTHNLGVAPELWIVKRRDAAQAPGWAVGSTQIPAIQYLVLNTTAASVNGSTYWDSSYPTATTFRVGLNSAVNQSGATYVAYLFASCPGVSKVGSYTGNGSSQTINCGFTGGARFVMIKRTDSTGDWYVWDTARGIVSANDPRLSLNSTAAEVTTDDSIDPDNSGFIVNQVSATNINVSSATYIYLAIA